MEPDTSIAPDTKDWTWTITRACPECGFDAAAVAPGGIADAVHAFAAPWADVLRRDDARDRPDPATWSPLEYGCHVRDVGQVFERRATLMLVEEDPEFENWDQDASAVEGRYGEQDPAVVASQVLEAADGLATVYASVRPEQWERSGRRSNGSVFTVLTLGQYALHDLAHHLWDVGVPIPLVGSRSSG